MATAIINLTLVSIHAPRAGRDPRARTASEAAHVSIHAPRAGRDMMWMATVPRRRCFNPRAPRGARLAAQYRFLCADGFNPRAPRGARLAGADTGTRSRAVSIHAPRAGRDTCDGACRFHRSRFQSTRPARGATFHQLIHRGRGIVSIHAPRAGRDTIPSVLLTSTTLFQSTRPARGATCAAADGAEGDTVSIHAPRAGRDAILKLRIAPGVVSIHAPRAGRDPRHAGRCQDSGGFNPRAPRGARRTAVSVGTSFAAFQSTRPARGATTTNRPPNWRRMFQSTRPARGATCGEQPRTSARSCFNPRAPRGARRYAPFEVAAPWTVSIHAPRAGRDVSRERTSLGAICFNPRAPRGARRMSDWSAATLMAFQSTRPARGATALKGHGKRPFWFQSTRPARGATNSKGQYSFQERVSIHAPRAGRDDGLP